MSTTELSNQKTPPTAIKTINLWSLAGELGLIIAVPLLILIIFGVKLDKKLGTTPLFIIIALVVSMVVSTLGVARKIRQL